MKPPVTVVSHGGVSLSQFENRSAFSIAWPDTPTYLTGFKSYAPPKTKTVPAAPVDLKAESKRKSITIKGSPHWRKPR